jgi:hypothetical protein
MNKILKIIPKIMKNKRAYIFDLDDTLIESHAHIYIYDHNNNLVDQINSRDYVNKRNIIKSYYDNNYRVDTYEFGGLGNCENSDKKSYEMLFNGKTLYKQLNVLKEIYGNSDNDIYIVTGRANKPETIKNLIYNKFNINILLNNIYPVSNKQHMHLLSSKLEKTENSEIINMLKSGKNATNHKKLALYDILSKKYNYVTFYDDDPFNINCFNDLILELSILGINISTKSYLIK